VVWVGYDDNKPLGSGETGASTALPAWIALMKAAHENKPRAEFPRPPGVVTVAIDPKTGKRAATEEGALDEVFLEGTEPTETAEIKDDAGPSSADAAAPATTTTTTTTTDAGSAP
jgi:penicillin-binding protein 1A